MEKQLATSVCPCRVFVSMYTRKKQALLVKGGGLGSGLGGGKEGETKEKKRQEERETPIGYR
jgi:hypothetical protein